MGDAIQLAARAVHYRRLALKEIEPRRAQILFETSAMFQTMARGLTDHALAAPVKPVRRLAPPPSFSIRLTVGGLATALGRMTTDVARHKPAVTVAVPAPRLQRA